MDNKKCKCCNKHTLPKDSIFEICPVCNWQDDGVQNDDPNYSGGANEMSLIEAKQIYFEGNRKHY